MSGYNSEDKDVTRIDLGEDLLKSNKNVEVSEKKQAKKNKIDPEDALKSAEILMSEGLIDEAKKILRDIYKYHPHNKSIKNKLDTIQEIEIKKILNEEDEEKVIFKKEKKKKKSVKLNSEKVMKDLDRDLNLGIFNDQLTTLPKIAELTLFKDEDGIEEFEKKLEKELTGSTIKDKLDIGIGFIEMGLHRVAIKIIEKAKKQAIQLQCDKNIIFNIVSMLAYAYIENGSPYKAIMELQPQIEDREVEIEEKVELYYLMGRAHSELGKRKESIMWYLKVSHIDENYRDIKEKLSKK